jgi:hypothetical protein
MVAMHCTYVSALWWGLGEVGGGGRFSHEGMVVVAVQEPSANILIFIYSTAWEGEW